MTGLNRAEMKVEIKMQKFFNVSRYFCIDGEVLSLQSCQKVYKVFGECIAAVLGYTIAQLKVGMSTILQSCIVKKFFNKVFSALSIGLMASKALLNFFY